MKPLVFMHIPKTGGTSIDYWLHSSFGAGQTFWFQADYINPINPREFTRLQRHEHLRCVVGHIPITIREYLPNRCLWSTLLRDPIERIISLYYAHKQYGSFPPNNLTLEQFALNPPYPEADNGMTRRLAGGEPDLYRARKNLARFSVVTTTDNVQLFCDAICARYPTIKFRPCTTRNVNGERPATASIDERVIQAIHRRQTQDLQLYELAQTLSLRL